MDLLSNLNEAQQRAVTHVDGPLLILAGAGSGKTRVITRRVAYLIQQGVAPWQILAITFTNKAAKEMARRIEESGGRGVTACTFHSLCARLLREFAPEANLSTRYSIYDTSDQTRLVKSAMEKAGLDGGILVPSKALSAISHAKMRLQTAEAFAAATTSADRLLATAYRAYEQALVAADALDFDDLLMRTAFLLRDRPDIRQQLGQRYRYVLIDEYQDTNHAQYIIAHGIALDHENVCATGDPDQSIYSWRGADVGNILDFETDYPSATVIRLEENYRSTAHILAAASRLVAYNYQRRVKALFTRREGGQDVTILTTTDEHAEAAEVVRRVADLTARGHQHDDIAVFYRLNSLSRVLEDGFRKTGTPYRIARGVAFYSRKEIKDVLAYLKLTLNANDNIACERIINVPARGIGATTLRRLGRWADRHSESLLGAARQAGQVPDLGKAAVARVARFVALMDDLSGLIDGPVKQIMEAALKRTGLEEDLRASVGEQRTELANVEELVTSAAEFDRENPGAGLADYLQLVALVSDADHFEGGSGAVTLMTLHAAKGLEFPVVIMVGCEAGVLPFHHPAGRPTDGEEERRLCFVGMTRAKDQLLLTHALYRSLRGVRYRQAPSRFLTELSGQHVTQIDLSELPGQDELDRTRHTSEADPWPTDDDFYDPETDPDATADESVGGMGAGNRVRHPGFGVGRVVSVSRSGPHTRVVVDFDQFGRKTLILQYAKLERLG